jgi:Ca2+-binding RTX toxin-like protein
VVTGSGRDSITGDDGNDVIRSGTGDDTIHGGSGNDDILADEGHDSVTGGDGNDTVTGNEGNDTVFGGGGNDVLNGSLGADWVDGGQGDDFVVHVGLLTGDVANGGDGFDTLRFNLSTSQGANLAVQNEIKALVAQIATGHQGMLVMGTLGLTAMGFEKVEVRIPTKLAGASDRSRPPIPTEAGRAFRAKAAGGGWRSAGGVSVA